MKVAYLLGSLNRGGTETLMLDVLRNAKNAPFEMICIHRKGGAYQEDFYSAGPKIIQCVPKRLGMLRYFRQLRKHLLREGVTIVHGQQPLDTLYVYLATLGTGIKVVQTFHGFYPMNGRGGMLTRMSIRMSDELCFVSKYEQDWYQQRMRIPDEKCHVVFNGIDFVKFDLAKSIVESQELKEKSKAQLCMVGSFTSGRAHDVIVRALQLLQERGVIDFDFYFIGQRGAAEPYIYDDCVRICEEKKMKHVHFLGGRGDVPSLLRVMDGFIYSTNRDTFGIAVVEAMAVGLPIVVNDWPVIKEVCGDMVAYYKSKDVGDCADAIEKLLAELPQRKETAKKNAEAIRKRYSIEAYLARLNNVYCKE